MGDFKGHMVPTVCFLLGGLLLLARAIRLKSTKWLRTNTLAILMPPTLFLIVGGVGGVGEFTDMALKGNWDRMSHWTHLRLDGIMFLSGVMSVLHVTRKIKGNAWSLGPPVSFWVAATVFLFHNQPDELELYGHRFASLLLYLLGFVYLIEAILALHMVPANYSNVLAHPDTNKFLHWQYSNPAVYKSMAPMSVAYVLLLNGTYWFNMATTFYIFEIPENEKNGDEAAHHALNMLYSSILEAFCLTFIVVLVLQVLTARYYPSNSAASGTGKHVPLTVILDDEEPHGD